MRTWLPALLALACAAASATEVYRWVDRDGKVHYGDRPRQGAKVVDVTPDSGSGTTDAESEKTAAARAAECERVKQQLEKYRAAPAIKEVNALGEEREYTAEDRQKLIARTEQQVSAACAPPESDR